MPWRATFHTISSQEGIRRVIRRVCSRLLVITLGMGLILLLLSVAFISYLMIKPIPLNLLTPYIEAVLPPALTGLQIDVQDVVLAWHGRAKRIVLSARDIHLRDAQGIIDATLPAVDVTLNLTTLLHQRVVALNKVYIDGAQFHLQAHAHDTLNSDTRLTLPLTAPPKFFEVLETGIAAFESDTLFADLRAVHIVNSAIALYSESLPRPLHISEFALTLRRTAVNISSTLSMGTSLSDTDIAVKLDTFYERSARHLSLQGKFANLRPSALATLSPTLSSLSGTTTSFTGSFNLAFNSQDQWPVADFNVQGDPGQVELPGLYREPLRIKEWTASGHLNGANETLQIETATVLDLGKRPHGNPRLHLQSTMTGWSRPTQVEGDVTLTAFTMADLKQYWPQGMGQEPRQWITQNIPEGLIHQTQAHFVLSASKAGWPEVVVQDINGSLTYEGLSVHYLRPLPPIQKMIGKGRFNRSGFHFQVASGNLANMALTESTVDITSFDRPTQTIAIQAGINGSLQEALTLLNHPRLDLIADLGIPLDTATGRFQIQPKFAFPLTKSLRMEEVDLHVKGTLQDVSLPEASLSQDLSNGQLSIDLDQHHMTIEGQAEWATIPLFFTWNTVFRQQGPDDWRDQMRVVIPQMGSAGRARLGFDWPDMIEGPIAAVIETQTGWDQQQVIDLQLDLRETALHLPWLNWHKSSGEPGNASGKLQLSTHRAMTLTDLHLETPTLKTRGSALFDGTTLTHVRFPHVTFGTSDLRNVVFQPLYPGLAITIGDGFLDAAPFRQLLINPSTTPDKNKNSAQPSAVFPIHLHLSRLHRLRMAPGRYLRNVQARLAWHETGRKAMIASGNIPAELTRQLNGKPSGASSAPKSFNFHYIPNAQQQSNLSLRTNDLGAMLRALNLYDNLIGGDITLTGRTNHDGTGITTKLQASQFTIQQAPVIAHVLAAASLHGLKNLLVNDGLKFNKIDAEITLYGDRLTIEQSNAHGGSLGITARGDIAYQTGGLDLQGTIIPAYLVNSLLGKVPVVNFLVGGKGQGLVAVNYHLTGQLNEPHVSVNPISALTPGFLRGVFGLFKKDKGEPTQTLPSQPAREGEMQISEP